MDFRTRILAAIDALKLRRRPASCAEIRAYISGSRLVGIELVAEELHAMARDGQVAYDRTAAGWRRA